MTSFNELFGKPAEKPVAAVAAVEEKPAAVNPFAALKQTIAQPQPVVAKPPLTLNEAIDKVFKEELNFGEQPEGFSEDAVSQLRHLFGQLQQSLGGDKVSDNLSRILTHLHNHPSLRDVLQPDDIHLIAKSVQASNGITIQKKMERKGTKTKRAAEAAEMANAFGAMNFVGPDGN